MFGTRQLTWEIGYLISPIDGGQLCLEASQLCTAKNTLFPVAFDLMPQWLSAKLSEDSKVNLLFQWPNSCFRRMLSRSAVASHGL